MFVLYVENQQDLKDKARLFEQYMEPILTRLETVYAQGGIPTHFREIAQYLKVCRWPFRKLEYSLVLDVLLDHLQPGTRFLDAGSGVTPLAYVFAERGVEAWACDGDAELIKNMTVLRPQRIYNSHVTYEAQDLTRLSYPDAHFDAISCVSVLEHIPPPYDQKAIQEILRVLKPGGIFVLTVDFTPSPKDGSTGATSHYWRRIVALVRQGNLLEIGRGLARKLRARQVAQTGAIRHARSANQCFSVSHLVEDILPKLQGEPISSDISFSHDLYAVTLEDARHFWDLQPGLFQDQGERYVLPAAYVLRKD